MSDEFYENVKMCSSTLKLQKLRLSRYEYFVGWHEQTTTIGVPLLGSCWRDTR